MRGQRAAVTGAGRGIGLAVAAALAEAGAEVILLDRSTEVESAGAALTAQGHRVRCDLLDVTDAAAVAEVVARHWAEGAVDVWVNNAGVSSMRRVVDLTEHDWDVNMDVNAKGVFLCTQAIGRWMLRRGRGRIINVASMASLKGVPLLAHYAASKWAVLGFTKSVAQEFAPSVTVNAVCPGYVATSMQERELGWEAALRGMTPEGVFREYVEHTPLGRIETPGDVARAVRYLASDEAAFLTGVALPVTGGADLA